MSFYARHILPHLIEWACRSPGAAELRRQIVPQAVGRVLEIGVGTGLNLPFYDSARVEQVWGVDPGAGLTRYTTARIADAPVPVEILPITSESLPFDDGWFDTAVSTFTLCTIPDVAQALRELRRVLRPGGRLLFCEHGQAPDARIRRLQDGLNPAWKRVSGGCNLNRNIAALIADAGFQFDRLEEGYLDGFALTTYTYRGSAV